MIIEMRDSIWPLSKNHNHMKNKILLYLVSLCFLEGCSTSNEPNVSLNLKFEDFNQSKELIGKKYQYDSILNPRKILLKNDYLIVSTDGSKNLLHLIDINSLGYIQSKGVHGQGPGEIRSMIWELDWGIDENSFWAYDLNSKIIYEYDLDSKSKYAVRSVRQKQDWFLGFSVHLMDENKFISNVTRDNFKYGIFDSLGNRLDSFGPWAGEKEIGEETGYLLLGLNQGQIDFNFKNKILSHSRLRFELLEIYNLAKGNTVSIYGPNSYEVVYDVFNSNGMPSANVDSAIPMGYSDVFVGENSVFAVYIGKTNSSITSSGETSRTIFEFSLEGKPLSHFTTNYPIKSISVDEINKKIYAVTEDKDPGIAVFDF
jgi:hypothetical protein